MKYTPVFEKDGQQFIAPYADMVGDTKDDTFKIAMGTMLVEGVILGFKVTNPIRYIELDDEGKCNVIGQRTELGKWDIVVLDVKAMSEKETAGALDK